MTRQSIHTDDAPAALGPYSQAIVAGGFVFCSGMAGIDPKSGRAVEGIEAQTEQALTNLGRRVLAEAGSSLADLVKVTIFYADVEDFPALNEVYALLDRLSRRRHARRRPTSACPGVCWCRSRPSRSSPARRAPPTGARRTI